MIHRLLYTALQNGLQRFRDTPALFYQLFAGQMLLSESEVEAVKKYFVGGFPKIEHGYSPQPATVPCYIIALGSEGQTDFALGNTAGINSFAPNGPTPVYASTWRHQFSIMCYAKQPDLVVYMYELAKAALSYELFNLQARDCNAIEIGGQDVSVDDRSPERLFVRVITFSCKRNYRLYSPDPTPRKFAVDGVYIDDGSDASQNGGVTALMQVTTSSTED